MMKPAAAVVATALILATQMAHGTVTATQSGQVRGVPAKGTDGVTVYWGIPYAAPPLGDLRWRAPQGPLAWTGIREASAAPPGCMQMVGPISLPWTEEFLHRGAVSEDCLYLNLWTPTDSTTDRLPVLVFIPGGGFTEGSGSAALYNGAALARKKIIVVTINYRLGAFGFLAHPALTQESEHHASGNYGLMDQVAALNWVHANIAAFNGDPNAVTLAGQSVGAVSAYLLTASPQAKGLFQRAILESGPGALAFFGVSTGKSSTTTLKEAEKGGIKFAKNLGATTAAELRSLEADRLVAQLAGDKSVKLGPVVDGWFLPTDADTAYATHHYNDVPMLTGMMADEPSGFLKYDAAKAKATRAQGLHALDEFLAARAKSSSQPVFAYYFEHSIPWPEHPQFGAFHSGEVPYVFDNLAALNRPWTAADRQLAVAVSSYWAAFAATGIPSGQSLPEWAAYRPGSLTFMVFADHPEVRTLSAKLPARFKALWYAGIAALGLAVVALAKRTRRGRDDSA